MFLYIISNFIFQFIGELFLFLLLLIFVLIKFYFPNLSFFSFSNFFFLFFFFFCLSFLNVDQYCAICFRALHLKGNRAKHHADSLADGSVLQRELVPQQKCLKKKTTTNFLFLFLFFFLFLSTWHNTFLMIKVVNEQSNINKSNENNNIEEDDMSE